MCACPKLSARLHRGLPTATMLQTFENTRPYAQPLSPIEAKGKRYALPPDFVSGLAFLRPFVQPRGNLVENWVHALGGKLYVITNNWGRRRRRTRRSSIYVDQSAYTQQDRKILSRPREINLTITRFNNLAYFCHFAPLVEMGLPKSYSDSVGIRLKNLVDEGL